MFSLHSHHVWGVLCCCWLWAGSANASVLASLDRTAVAKGSSVQLTISVEGEDGEPDLAPLQHDFEILSRSQSSQFSFVNGHSSSKKSWAITLMPRRSGVVTIAAIAVGKGRSNPLRLTVSAEGSPPALGSASVRKASNLFIEAAIAPDKGRVQQQLIYTVQLFRAVNLTQAQLSEPKANHAVVVRLGDDRNYETVRNGKRFVVTERKYAIFPQRRGTLTIAPLRFDGQMMGGGSMFDPFNRRGQMVRRFSNPVHVDVVGAPVDWRGGNWLPASAMVLTQSLSAGPYKVGEPITRKVELRASGLTAAQLSSILDGVLPDGIKRYPDQPQTRDTQGKSGVVGVRSEKVALIPLHGGNFMLPGIDIPWWNVTTGKMEMASIAPRAIHVEGVAIPSVTISSVTDAPVAASSVQGDGGPKKGSEHRGKLIWWQGGGLLLLLLWLATLGLWWRGRHAAQKEGEGGCAQVDGDEIALRQQVQAACRSNNDALLVQVLSVWSRRLKRQGIDVAHRFPYLTAEMARLHRQRYGSGGDVDISKLLIQFERVCAELDASEEQHSLSLPPLYRD